MNKIVNKISINAKFDIGVKNVKNMKFNSQIFKICRHVNIFQRTFYLIFFQNKCNKMHLERKAKLWANG